MSAVCQYDSERTLNNGTLKATRSYYNWDTYGGRLHTIQSGTTGSPTSMQNLTYQAYDNNGNILRLDNPYEKNLSGTQVTARTLYTYDDLNRLIQAEMLHLTLPTQYYLQDYDYDGLGRLETKGGTSLTYSEPNGKLHAVSAAGSITYQYDANGNMTARNTGVPTTSYVFSYDSENRLSMATSSNTTVRFVYDGDGSRVETIQTVISTTTTTITIGGYYEWTSSSDWKKYYFAGSERIAFMKYSNLMYYLFSDHLGSTVVTRYQLGNVYRNGYYPFGEERYSSSYTPYQFTGQRNESVIGLYDYHARFYDPSIGRFVQADTIVPGPGSPQSWDRYAYVNNNPVRYSDPSGNYFCEDDCTHHNSLNYSANDIYITKLLEYGVATFGDWSTKELSTIYAGIRSIGSKFYSYSSFINGSPSSIFRAVFRNGVSVRKSTTAGGFCEASGAGFSCLSNVNLDTGLVIHEFGHTFNATFINESFEGLSPYNRLANSSLFTSDFQFITGLHRVLRPDGNGYETKWDRTFNGYVSSRSPDVYHGSDWSDWNSVGEDFADMFANWVKGSFSVDKAGNIRNGFMQAYIGAYIYKFTNK